MQQRENDGEHAGVAPEIPDADRERPDAREAVACQNQQRRTARTPLPPRRAIQTIGISARDAAAGRVRARRPRERHAAGDARRRRAAARRPWETDRLLPSDTRESGVPHSRDSAGDVQ